MTRRTRNILFLILVVLFLIVAPITVFYSLGWRFDWETKRIIQTGMFYVKAWPKNVQVYLDGELKEKTDVFFGSATIDNLIPQKYSLEIRKDSYHSWAKTLEIKKREVTEMKNIILIPQNPNFSVLTDQVKEFFFSPDREKIILKQEDEEQWSLKLFELRNNLKSHLINEEDISIKGVEIINLSFSPDSERILLELGLKENIQYYIIEIDQNILSHLDFLDPFEEIYFHPKNNNLLVLTSSIDKTTKREIRTINEVDLANEEILAPLLNNVLTFSVTDDNLYYIDIEGFVYKNDFSDRKEKINIIPLELKPETDYELIVFDSYVFIRQNNVLYSFDEDSKSFEKFFEQIKDQKVSPDSKKMVYFNNYEISVLFLEEQYDHPQKGKGEQLFITRFSEEINNVFWYSNHYLVFNIKDKIKVAEIDDRDRINIVDLAEFKEPEIFFADKKLYILSEENLYVSDELTP